MKQEDGSPIHAVLVEQVEFGRWSFPDDGDPVRVLEVGLALDLAGNTYTTHVVVPLDVARSLFDQLREALGE